MSNQPDQRRPILSGLLNAMFSKIFESSNLNRTPSAPWNARELAIDVQSFNRGITIPSAHEFESQKLILEVLTNI